VRSYQITTELFNGTTLVIMLSHYGVLQTVFSQTIEINNNLMQ